MQTLHFTTPTTIDPRAWTIMGLSAKESANPIGYFGTGLKMAIAVLLRNGARLTITTPEETYLFGVKNSHFRDQPLQQITCNDECLPFTTDLAKNWSLEEAYRELVSNTIDEGGTYGPEVEFLRTVITVEHNDFAQCFLNHEKMFVGKRQPIFANDRLRIYRDPGYVFYRGVKVATLNNSLYSYELLTPVTLTEDRTVKFPTTLHSDIAAGISVSDDDLFDTIISPPSGSWESNLAFSTADRWHSAFFSRVLNTYKNAPTGVLWSLGYCMRNHHKDSLFIPIALTENESKLLEKALTFLSVAGYEVTAPIKTIKNNDLDNVAFVHNKQIYLTNRAFSQGLFFLVSTLLEEHFHTRGYSDESRAFERMLLDKVVQLLADKQDVVL